MKKILPFILVILSFAAKAQKIDSIYVNLYTDSLKKGTYNYINVDGLLSNGKYLPLDSTFLKFTASAGKFVGNTLWVDKNFTGEKISIKLWLIKNSLVKKEFDIWIKTKENGEKLRTSEEILNDLKKATPPSKGKKRKGIFG